MSGRVRVRKCPALENGIFGWSAIGLACWLLAIVPSYHLSKKNFRQSRELASARDLRVKQVQSTLQLLKVLKLNAWDSIMAGRIHDAREDELDRSYAIGLTKVHHAVFLSLTRGAAIMTILSIHIMVRHQELKASDAFAAVTL